jgi:peptide/nickel transport system permease protein
MKGVFNMFKKKNRLNEKIGSLLFFFKNNPLVIVGLSLFLCVIILVVFAPAFTPYDPIKVDIRSRLQPPSADHILGTDSFGRDVWSRLLFGGRNTLMIGISVIAFSFSVGVVTGLTSGFIGGALDNFVMRIVDALLSFPALVLAIALTAAFGASLQNAMLAIAITLTPQFARVSRGQAIQIRSKLYIEAAQSIGVSNQRMLWKYVLPNSIGPLMVQATLNFGSAILQTASLGFLGLGAQPPTAEWGADVSANTQYLRESPWVSMAPGVAILISVLAFNLIGDALADWFNPRTRKSAG